MEVRTAASPKDVKHYTTDRLREEFLIQNLFQADKINLVYSHIDRRETGAYGRRRAESGIFPSEKRDGSDQHRRRRRRNSGWTRV